MGGNGSVLAVALAALLCHLLGPAGGNTRTARGIKIPFLHKSDSESEYVKFRLFTRETLYSPEEVDSRDLRPFSGMKAGRPVIMNIHGWRGHRNCKFNQEIRNATFLSSKPKDVNLISVDWSGMGSRSKIYTTARSRVESVAGLVRSFLDMMAEGGLSLGDLHVVGHSLGSHIAGIAGREVKGKIGRITGLDPAGPLFTVKSREKRLTEESAEFVDVIHTSANVLGFEDPIGHVDFYPNGGKAVQPGCGFDVAARCSHRRAYEFYGESMYDEDGFLAVQCNDWSNFKHNICTEGHVVIMGEKTPKTARGVYYLRTNNEWPFAKEIEGTHYD